MKLPPIVTITVASPPLVGPAGCKTLKPAEEDPKTVPGPAWENR